MENIKYHTVGKYGSNKMENIKYHTVGKFPRSNGKIVETEAKSLLLTHIYMTPNTHIHDP
jgi:hypothetical protein